MSLEKGKISSSQLVFLIACFMQGTIFVTTYTFSNTPRDEWVVAIIALLISTPFQFMFIKLSAMYPKDSFIKINDKVYGNILGKAVSGFYCLYFILTSAGNFRFPSGFLNANFMIETPILVFVFFLLFLSILAVRGGIETISRVGLFTTIWVLLSLILYFLLLLNKMDFVRFLPIMDVPPLKIIQNVLIISSQYMGENLIFLMILPYVADREGIKKNFLIGFAIGFFSLFLIAITVTSVLGNVAAISTGPLVETTRHIEVLGILMRTEFVFMGFLTITAFYKSCVFYYITLLAVAELLKLRSYQVLIFPMALLIYSLVMTSAESGPSMSAAGRNGWAFFSFFILYILPLLTFATAVIKTLPKKGGSSA